MKEYDFSSIKILKGLEPVRKRPSMYIGNTGVKGLHHLIWEILDNAIDESLAGYCDYIKIQINKDESVTISDNGRGIPVGLHKSGKSTPEVIFTVLHAGGKFDSDIYKISGGLHGVGASVVNALSEFMNVRIKRNNIIYNIQFQNGGQKVQDLTEIGTCNDTGTEIHFKPDKTIFKDINIFNYQTIDNKIKQMAFLNKKITIKLIDERKNKEAIYHFPQGIVNYAEQLMVLAKTEPVGEMFYLEDKIENIYLDFCFQYNSGFGNGDDILTFCNNINTIEGGSHYDGLKLAFIRVMNKFNLHKNSRTKVKFNWEDITDGLIMILSIKHPDPQFEGQTKTKLGNVEVKNILNEYIGEKLWDFLLEHPKTAKIIIDKLTISNKGRLAALKVKNDIKNRNFMNNDLFNLPGKLTDCQSKEPAKNEIFIVEGDSAGGTAKSGRNREFQAILPLRGKILNVEKSTNQKIIKNNEIISIIKALGCDYKDKIILEKIRYHKIIIMTDADVDGSHIRILLLTLFYRYFKKIIQAGFLYIAQPPLYKIKWEKKSEYIFSDEDLTIKKEELTNKEKKFSIQRYKGLGEMNPDQLWDTTMNPATRILARVTLEDLIEANQICLELMGDDAAYRKEFINSNSIYASKIDF